MSLEPPTTERRMSHAEAVLLCRYAKAACPQQAFDQYTPDAWADLLSDLRFGDCQEAVKAVVQRQPFVAPAEIRAEVKRIRTKRIVDFGQLPDPPSGMSFGALEYRQWYADCIRQIGDGDALAMDDLEPLAMEAHDVIAELGIVRTVDQALSDPIKTAKEAAAAARYEAQAARKPEPAPLLEPGDHSREPEPAKAAGPTETEPTVVEVEESHV